MAFTQELWKSVEDVYGAILRHPFLRGLTDGSLSEESFRFYAVQDALYLREFARALSVAAARAPKEDLITLFNEQAVGVLKGEKSLHDSFFKEWGLTPAAIDATPLAPTNAAYTSYLVAVAYGGPYHEAIAALLPCFWIYWEVGKELVRTGSPDPLYTRWIATYASETYGGIVQRVIDATDEAAAGLGTREREAMKRHFVLTSRYEWMFWDMGYRRESWPV